MPLTPVLLAKDRLQRCCLLPQPPMLLLPVLLLLRALASPLLLQQHLRVLSPLPPLLSWARLCCSPLHPAGRRAAQGRNQHLRFRVCRAGRQLGRMKLPKQFQVLACSLLLHTAPIHLSTHSHQVLDQAPWRPPCTYSM